MRKKLSLTLVAFLATLSLAACGGEAIDDDSSGGNSTQEQSTDSSGNVVVQQIVTPSGFTVNCAVGLSNGHISIDCDWDHAYRP